MPQHFENTALSVKQYNQRQSTYDDVPGPLGIRLLMLAPSNSGKTNLLVHMITDVYKDCFTAGCHIFSNSINLDDAWIPVKRYLEANGFPPEKYCHEGYDDELMGKLLSEQKQIIEFQKKKGQGGSKTPLHGMLLVMDDILDDAKVMRRSKNLELLFVRARHMAISTIVSVQKYRAGATPPIVRISTSDDIIFKLRNQHDLQAWIEESSALADPEIIMDIYRRCMETPYNFLWLKKTATDPNDIFHIGFNPGEIIS